MGLRFRRSVSLGKGLRLNFGKKGMSVSAGVRGAHVTYNTNGRKTTSIGIPGTGISYVKSGKTNGKRTADGNGDLQPANGDNSLLGSNPPPKKNRGCLFSGIVGLVVFIIVASAINSCGGGNSASSQASSKSSEIVSEVSSASSKEQSSAVQSSHSVSSAATSPAAKPAANSKLTITDAPGTVAAGSDASLTIKGKPNTSYSIAVYYSSGASKAGGLSAQTTDSDGTATWSWKVGRKTKAGTHRIVISGGGEKVETSITITK